MEHFYIQDMFYCCSVPNEYMLYTIRSHRLLTLTGSDSSGASEGCLEMFLIHCYSNLFGPFCSYAANYYIHLVSMVPLISAFLPQQCHIFLSLASMVPLIEPSLFIWGHLFLPLSLNSATYLSILLLGDTYLDIIDVQ